MEKDVIRNQADIGVDIVVPVYRVEKYLRRCLDSILNQTHNNFKLIIVDDGSDDKSPEICDEYALKDSRIHVIHKENGGLSSARNAGIDWAMINSNNKWITFIDSDDMIHLQFLEFMCKAVNENKVEISRCALKSFSQDSEINTSKLSYNISVMDADKAYLIENSDSNVCAQGKLYRKDLFEEIRYPIGKLHEDLFTTYKLYAKSQFVAVLDNELYMYFYNPDGIIHSVWSPRRLDEFEAFEEQLAYFKNRNKTTYISLVTKYIQAISRQYSMICSDSDKIVDNEKYMKMMKIKIRTLIKEHIFHHSILFSKCKWGYEIAFPSAMGVYWRIQALCSRERR